MMLLGMKIDLSKRPESPNFASIKKIFNIVPWCNWLTRLTLDQKSLGSSPSGTAL